MNILRRFFWKPAGCIPSLESLDASSGMRAKWEVTAVVRGPNQGQHPLTVVELCDAKIIGNLRIIATADDVAIGGVQSLFNCPDPQNHYLMRRRRFRIPKYRHGWALLLGAANSDNYYHWLLESVPRWTILQAAGRLDYDFVLLHDRPSRFQDEVLDRLNVPAGKRLRCSKHFVHQFERLVVPAMPFPVEEVPAWVCARVRSLFPNDNSGPEKIYMRRGGGRRRLVNEMELEAALRREGFVSIQPDRISVAEQAKLLSSARCVVAPHGAALTNLVFAPPGALLLELSHPQYKKRGFVNLAAACGHRYASVDGYAKKRLEDRQSEYSVDVPAVLDAIAKNS